MVACAEAHVGAQARICSSSLARVTQRWAGSRARGMGIWPTKNSKCLMPGGLPEADVEFGILTDILILRISCWYIHVAASRRSVCATANWMPGRGYDTWYLTLCYWEKILTPSSYDAQCFSTSKPRISYFNSRFVASWFSNLSFTFRRNDVMWFRT